MVINSQKVALLCPGQASQKVGMCNDLYKQGGFAKEHIDIACDILGYDIKSIMFDGPKEILSETIHTQPAIFIASFIVGNLLINNGLKPKCIAGHSVGEVSAYTLAKSLDFENGLKLVQFRAKSMHKAGLDRQGSMAAVIGIDEKILEDICLKYSNGQACVANYNSPTQAVISGDSSAIEDITPKILSAGALKVIKLNVSGAFHSPLMNSAKEKLNEFIKNVKFYDPIFPVYSNTTSFPIDNKNDIPQSLVKQLISPVLWYKSVHEMISNRITSGIEIGPGKVLQGLSKRIDSSLNMYGAETHQDILNLGHV